jgi:hypothetical protein
MRRISRSRVFGGRQRAHFYPHSRTLLHYDYRENRFQTLKPAFDLVIEHDSTESKSACRRAHDDVPGRVPVYGVGDVAERLIIECQSTLYPRCGRPSINGTYAAQCSIVPEREFLTAAYSDRSQQGARSH